MQKHTSIYFKHFGYTIADFVCCEICGAKATETGHIFARGMGGRDSMNVIENLQAICRSCHIRYGDQTDSRQMLLDIHEKKLIECGKPYNKQFFTKYKIS